MLNLTLALPIHRNVDPTVTRVGAPSDMITPMRALILSAPVGAGHDAAARAVQDELAEHGVEAEVDDGLAMLGLSRIVVDGYRFQILHAAWSWRLMYRMSRHPRLIRLLGWWLSWHRGKRLLERIEESQCDYVVSAYPLVSAALAGLRRRGRLNVPCATLITDFDPHPGWLHPDLDANLAVGHDVPGVALIRPPVCGFNAGPGARERVRAELGIPAASKVVLIVGGAWGVGNLEGAARVVDGLPGFHAIVVTGKNEGLRKHMAADHRLSHTSVLGYTDRMPDLMDASDVLIQNAGGVTCLEAFSTGLPVVMFDPLPGHGEDNSRHMANEGTIVLADGDQGLRRLLLDEDYWSVTALSTIEMASALFDRPGAASHLEGLSIRSRSWIARRRVISVAFASFLLMGWVVTEHSPLDFGTVGLLPSHVFR